MTGDGDDPGDRAPITFIAREFRVRDRTLSIRGMVAGRATAIELAVLVDQAVDEETQAPHARGPFPPTLRVASLDHTRESWEHLKIAIDRAFEEFARRWPT